MRHLWKHGRLTLEVAVRRWAPSGLCIVLATILLAWFGPSVASARPSDQVALEVSAPPRCPTRSQILSILDTQLGSAFETDTRLRAEINIEELSASDFVLTLRYRTSTGAQDARQLHGESCAAVAEAAAWVLALVLDPRAVPDIEEPSARTPPRHPDAGWDVAPSAGVHGVFDTALMPETSGGFGAHLGLRLGPIELRVRGQLLLPRDHQQGGVTATFRAWSVDLGACAHVPLGPAVVGPCLRAEVGSLSGQLQGGDVVVDSPGKARIQALGLGGEARWPVAPPLWIAISADFTWMTRRPAFDALRAGSGETEDIGVQVAVGQSAKFGMRVCLGPLLAW